MTKGVKSLLNIDKLFRSDSYKIEVMIIFVIEMLELPNFGHMATSII